MKTFSKFIAFIFCFVAFTFMQTLILSWLFIDISSLNLFNLSIEHYISNYCLMITKAPNISSTWYRWSWLYNFVTAKRVIMGEESKRT